MDTVLKVSEHLRRMASFQQGPENVPRDRINSKE